MAVRLAITVLSLLALLGAPAASDNGCLGCCKVSACDDDGRGRDIVCACCGERVKPEDWGPKYKTTCRCEHHIPQQAPQRTADFGSLNVEPVFLHTDAPAASAAPLAPSGVNHTPAEVFTPLRV